MIEGVDYCYIYPKDDDKITHIKLLSGKYAGTLYKYGKVKIYEQNDQGHLVFAYDVLESPVAKPKKLEKDDDFKNYIGNFLAEIMSLNIDEEILDENGTEDPEKSDL
jgi:hypothetical protein